MCLFLGAFVWWTNYYVVGIIYSDLHNMSGIMPSDAAVEAYKRVKTGKDAWAVFAVQDEKSVECTKVVVTNPEHKSSEFTNFEKNVWTSMVEWVGENMTDKAGYIIVDVKGNKDGRDQAKLTVISWCPENKLKVKAKMLHGSTLNAVKQCFEGLQGKPVQAGSLGDLELADVYSEVGL